MEKKTLKFKRFLIELLGVIFLFSVCIQAQNHNPMDTTKTDTSKSDTSHIKKETLGYNNINFIKNNAYSLNYNINSAYFSNSSVTDTSKTDTAYKKPDTLGYNRNGNFILAIARNYIRNLYLPDSSITDTSKTDTTWKKTDSLGYKNIKSPNYSYAFKGNIGSHYYFQNDSSMKDTSKTDTAKSDTLGFNKSKNNYYTSNNRINSISNTEMKSHFLVNPIKDLTQKLKLNVYLMDKQTDKVQQILREYEARTYQSNGDNEILNEAAINAQKNIADILTERQKKEWENARNEWWASVNRALNLSSINKNKNNLQ